MMTRVVPDETDTLCESCGYTLNGLAGVSNCPECGQPIAGSTNGDGRGLTGFEQRTGASSFLATTWAVLVRPRRFYRGILTRSDHPAAAWFAQRHQTIAAALFALAAVGYVRWIGETGGPGLARRFVMDPLAAVGLGVGLFIGLCFLLRGLTRLTAWLSALEGRFWGMRLTPQATRRALLYHTANYTPVAVLAAGTVWGYRALLDGGLLDRATALYYPWTLSALVVLSAGHLFRQYLIAMRGIRFANR